MKLRLTTILWAPPERVWRAVQSPGLLRYVAQPFVTFEPVRPTAWPAAWDEGSYEVALRLLGRLPLGRQVIRITRATEGGARVMRDRGGGTCARRWHHTIRVTPEPGGFTRYSDELEVRAGVLTPVVWAFAHGFFRHRQRRLRELARTGFDHVD